jgi:ubiquinone/menaquinone biosynthesis C-methylase UbiE
MSTELTMLVREKYGEAALRADAGAKASCCGTGSSCGADPITTGLYSAEQVALLPELAVAASLGCGNPTALAELAAGEVVLDLGSGGGIDVLLSARRVGPTGRAFGVDMTDEMLALARRNQAAAGIANAEFLQGTIDAIPLPDASVDVVISNCVVNLAGDKRAVLREAFRVLRPGGRFAITDVVTRGVLPPAIRESLPLWTGCVAGALDERVFAELLREVGFAAPTIESVREYTADDARAILADGGLDADVLAPMVEGHVFSAFVRATKPEST